MSAPTLKTQRLLLRQWKESDLNAFASLNSDPRVMEYFPSTLTQEESDQLADRIQKELSEKPYGLWAVELDGTFIGIVGLHEIGFMPGIEIGWRLAYSAWGQGYAQEAARKVINYAFNTLKLDEIASFTSIHNHRSIKLMQRLGMTHNPQDDFDHPKIPDGHPLKRHVLFRLSRNSHLT